MRLIDADELSRKIQDEYHGSYSEVQIAPYQIGRMIDDAPTVDAEPVKHAHVVWTKPNISYQTQCCSNCHRTFISRPDETIQFCPHCGAKMVKVEGEKS